jgi:hypothetical protein
VHLDLRRLRDALSREDGCEYTIGDVRRWLQHARFRPLEDVWLVREADLGQVQPSEVVTLDEWALEATNPDVLL